MSAHITTCLKILLWLPNAFGANSEFTPWLRRVTPTFVPLVHCVLAVLPSFLAF